MKKLKLYIPILFIVFCMIPVQGICAKTKYVKINKVNFPDKEFRYIVKTFDKNKDNKLSEKEISNVKKLYLNPDRVSAHPELMGATERVKNLKGLKYFTNIRILDIQNSNITSLSLPLPKLTRLYMNCSNLKKFKLSGGKNLQIVDLQDYNATTKLHLEKFPNLESFSLSTDMSFEYSDLGIESCANLKMLNLYNQLTAEKIDFTKNKKLEFVYLNGTVNSIDCTGLKKLKEMYIDNIGLKKITVKGCSNLVSLTLEKNPLSKIDVTGLDKLTDLRCEDTVKVIGAKKKDETKK